MPRPLPILATLLALASVVSPQSAWAQGELRSGHFTTSDGVKLHYLEEGSGRLLVFVPGWTMPAWIWEPQLEHFAANHRVVALDPRGQGRSEKPTHGYNPSRRARDVCELLAHLGGEPAVVVGWSLGVQEVLLCAQEGGTEAIRAAVLVDYEIVWENTEELTPWFISLQTEREDWTRTFVESIHLNPSEEYVEALTQAALMTPTNAAALMLANLILMGPTDLRPAVDSLDRPVLFVYSSLDWAVAAAGEVRHEWPEVPVEIIDETSHALFVDKPDEFNRVLEGFLLTLPEE
jgi:microsomal epoxide hydrolase